MLTFKLFNDEGLGKSNRIKKAVICATTKADQELLAKFIVAFYEWRKEHLIKPKKKVAGEGKCNTTNQT